jgi:hypothetical protein
MDLNEIVGKFLAYDRQKVAAWGRVVGVMTQNCADGKRKDVLIVENMATKTDDGVLRTFSGRRVFQADDFSEMDFISCDDIQKGGEEDPIVFLRLLKGNVDGEVSSFGLIGEAKGQSYDSFLANRHVNSSFGAVKVSSGKMKAK